ncbi:Sugar kinase of the NBD/HSP70 family, may contain an N-terminal HTH domain [Nakamurella panacisegetis]|uniref:Sugar kinase of the NBD/HSP70 family, may contain an N-terminal HTH domain n=1 Tax=Nakamurella panacisegetis TaxID=1090615 RepID=A0A1H0L0V7_9ACTN|nr:ROK family transcriptional regulator [Nakamurella panacisegetis]SDO61924.1 Sugar kinase of the NBD/HSP70 family, may contain an N-terminal HTH domain [Nakamurella panacisegetis]
MAETYDSSSPRMRTREDLYQLIRSREQVTRAELVELTGMSRSTVNHAIGKLLTEGRVTETDMQTKGPGSGSGRPATGLKVVVSGAPVAAIDFGHNHIHVAIGDALGGLLAEQRARINVDLRANDAMDFAAELLGKLRREVGADQLSALVAGIPGPVDTKTGLVRSSTILSSWVGLAPAQELERRTGLEVHVENDALLGAFGERKAGAGRQHPTFLYIKASHGIGAGLVLGGELYKGVTGVAGEIGHTYLAGRTELCRCGNRGCLEAVVSVQSLLEQVAHTHPTVDADALTLDALDDTITHRLLNEAGRILGGVLADLCNLLNPGALIIGGELGAAGTSLLEGVEASVERYAQPATAAVVEILPAALGVRAELTGGLLLAAFRSAR